MVILRTKYLLLSFISVSAPNIFQRSSLVYPNDTARVMHA